MTRSPVMSGLARYTSGGLKDPSTSLSFPLPAEHLSVIKKSHAHLCPFPLFTVCQAERSLKSPLQGGMFCVGVSVSLRNVIRRHRSLFLL